MLGLLEAEYELRQRNEGVIDLEEYARRFPAYIEELRATPCQLPPLLPMESKSRHSGPRR